MSTIVCELLTLPNGNLIAPALIRGVVKFPGKGVAFRSEYNKLLDFEKEPDPLRQQVVVIVIRTVLRQGRDWKQPDWQAEFAKITETPPPTKKDKAA